HEGCTHSAIGQNVGSAGHRSQRIDRDVCGAALQGAEDGSHAIDRLVEKQTHAIAVAHPHGRKPLAGATAKLAELAVSDYPAPVCFLDSDPLRKTLGGTGEQLVQSYVISHRSAAKRPAWIRRV